MPLGLYDAGDLSPMLEIRLGEKTFPVPPLTLARFMKLTACNWSALLKGILGSKAPGVGEPMTDEDVKNPRAFAAKLGASLVDFPHVPFAPLIAAVVPGLTEKEWGEHGTPVVMLDLYYRFATAHDWKLIADAIGFGKPVEKAATGATIAGALMAFCQAYPFYKPEDLLAMRVDYFFLIRNGVAPVPEDAAAALEDVSSIGHTKDPTNPLWAALDEADRKAASA
jgi:hypothetical protein